MNRRAFFLPACFVLLTALISASFDLFYLPAAVVSAILAPLLLAALGKREGSLRLDAAYLAVLFIAALAIMVSSGMFDPSIPTFADTPYHFYHSWLVSDVLLPDFSGIFGWNPFFQLGHMKLYDLPPAFFVSVALIQRLSAGALPLHMAFRLLAALSFFLPLLSIYILSRKGLGAGSGTAFLASLLFLAFRHHSFENGVFTAEFSLGLAFLGGCLLLNDRPALSALLLSLSFMSHPTVFIFSAIFLVSLFLLKKGPAGAKDLAIAGILFAFLSAPYLYEIFEGRSYSSAAWKTLPSIAVGLFDAAESLVNDLWRVPHLSAAAILALTLGWSALPRSSRPALGALAVLASCVAIVALGQRMGIGILNFLVLERAVLVLLAAMAAVSAILISSVVLDLGRDWLRRFAMVLPAAYFISFYLIYLAVSWRCPSCTTLFDRVNSRPNSRSRDVFGSWYAGLAPREGIFSSEVDRAFFETARFLSNSSSASSRVLFEDSSRTVYGGWLVPLLPISTGLSFLGGPSAPMRLDDRRNANAYDGTLFGKPVSAYSPEGLADALKTANVETLVVWSDQFIAVLDAHPEMFVKEFVSPNGTSVSLKAYRFVQAPRDFAIPAQEGSGARTDSMEPPGRMVFRANGSFTVSVRYSPYWQALDERGSRIPVVPMEDDILMRAVLPDSRERTVTFRFVPPLASRLAEASFAISFALIAAFQAGNSLFRAFRRRSSRTP